MPRRIAGGRSPDPAEARGFDTVQRPGLDFRSYSVTPGWPIAFEVHCHLRTTPPHDRTSALFRPPYSPGDAPATLTSGGGRGAGRPVVSGVPTPAHRAPEASAPSGPTDVVVDDTLSARSVLACCAGGGRARRRLGAARQAARARPDGPDAPGAGGPPHAGPAPACRPYSPLERTVRTVSSSQSTSAARVRASSSG